MPTMMQVGYAFGRSSYEQLQQLGVNVEFNTYRGMGHSACAPEMQDMLAFIKARLS